MEFMFGPRERRCFTFADSAFVSEPARAASNDAVTAKYPRTHIAHRPPLALRDR